MPLPDILGYIALGITWFLAITWAFGIRSGTRLRNVANSTVLSALYLLILALVFTFSPFSNLHLFWLLPLGFLLVPIQISFAFQSSWFRHISVLIASLYTALLQTGIKTTPRFSPTDPLMNNSVGNRKEKLSLRESSRRDRKAFLKETEQLNKEPRKKDIIFTDIDGEEYTEENLRLIWHLLCSEQLEDIPTREMIDAINEIVRNNEYGEMWELDYFDEDED